MWSPKQDLHHDNKQQVTSKRDPPLEEESQALDPCFNLIFLFYLPTTVFSSSSPPIPPPTFFLPNSHQLLRKGKTTLWGVDNAWHMKLK